MYVQEVNRRVCGCNSLLQPHYCSNQGMHKSAMHECFALVCPLAYTEVQHSYQCCHQPIHSVVSLAVGLQILLSIKSITKF